MTTATRTCPDCDGLGWLMHFESFASTTPGRKVDCATCRTSGSLLEPEVEVILTACEECGGLSIAEAGCPLCGGQGLVEVAR